MDQQPTSKKFDPISLLYSAQNPKVGSLELTYNMVTGDVFITLAPLLAQPVGEKIFDWSNALKMKLSMTEVGYLARLDDINFIEGLPQRTDRKGTLVQSILMTHNPSAYGSGKSSRYQQATSFKTLSIRKNDRALEPGENRPGVIISIKLSNPPTSAAYYLSGHDAFVIATIMQNSVLGHRHEIERKFEKKEYPPKTNDNWQKQPQQQYQQPQQQYQQPNESYPVEDRASAESAPQPTSSNVIDIDKLMAGDGK